MDGDYIVLNRKIQQWEWYKNSNTKDLFIHCLLNANWCDTRYQGRDIPRGSFVTTVKKLSLELGFSCMQIRTALNHLILTNELTIETTTQYSIITVNNYSQYQIDNKQTNKRVTNEQQTNNKRITNGQEEEMTREEENGEEKRDKEERERTKEKEETELKEEDREVEKSKEVEGKRREEGKNLLEKESKKESKTETMENAFKKYSEQFPLSDILYDKLKEWCLYKIQRKEYYVDRGVKSLVKKTSDMSREYGDLTICNLIDESMASNYQGIVWDKLSRTKTSKSFYEKWRDA